MNFKCLFLVVVILVQCVMNEAKFSPVKWNPSLSEECGKYDDPELIGVLTTLTKLIVNNKAPSSLPKSCMERRTLQSARLDNTQSAMEVMKVL